MTNEFKIISEDGLKTLCKAIQKVSTIGEIIDDVNSVTDKTYSSFEIDRRLNTKANDSEVVKKTDIVDNLTSTDTDEPLSANQGKILNDTKLNKTDVNKMNCVSIDNVSLKEYILTNFTEREKTYYLIAKTTCTDLPKASNFYITVETPGLYTYKVTAKELNDSNGIYVSTYRTISSSWTAWQKIATQKDLDDLFQSVSNGKNLIASAITDKGVDTLADATFEQMADNIGMISGGGSGTIPTLISMSIIYYNSAEYFEIDISKTYIVMTGLLVYNEIKEYNIAQYSIINGVVNNIIEPSENYVGCSLSANKIRLSNTNGSGHGMVYVILQM